MAPQRNNDRNERHSGHTGTIPKTKVRNNCNVPQEAVTPTRRDMTSNLVSTSLDWVPVSEYNTRSNYNQSRKPPNNTSDQELTDLDNSVSYESGFGRFVPVRPQPRILPLNVQNRENLTADHNDDGAGSTASGYSQHAYPNSIQNGLNPHSNHAAAAVMIVNPTTPNAVAGNISQPFNAPGNQNRNNLTRNLNPSRNNFDGNSNASNNTTPPVSNRAATKTVNLINNMYDSGQGSSNNSNENHQAHRETARALGEAIVAACPDTAAVERRLGQIREYIRVTSSLVDTMRNSEDEAYIEHTKEEYDELVEMVMKLKESESKLVTLIDKPDNIEVPAEEIEEVSTTTPPTVPIIEAPISEDPVTESTKENNGDAQTLKKVTNVENEQLNKTLHKFSEENLDISTSEEISDGLKSPIELPNLVNIVGTEDKGINEVEVNEIDTYSLSDTESGKDDQHLNNVLRQNILSCVEKVALIKELKHTSSDTETQEVVVRPMSVQSNGSAYSENELWQNEIKNKMEISQQRLASLKQQQKRLLKYQAEAKQQLEDMHRARQSQEILPSTSHDNLASMQNQMLNGHQHHQSRMFAANQIGVATTLPHSSEGQSQQPNMTVSSLSNVDNEQHIHDERFIHRDANVASSEEAAGGRDSDVEDEDGLTDRGRQLTMKLRELHLKKQHMEGLVSEFQKLQMATRMDSSHNTYSSSGEESLDEEPSRKCNKSSGNNKNEDPFKLMEIKAIKQALQKTKDLMRSVENYEADHLSGIHDETFQMPTHSNIHDNKSGSEGGWSEGSAAVCRVRNSLPQRHKFTNEQQQQQSHEANLASLQDLAQELRMETEKIMGERTRLKEMVANKEFSRKHKKVNEEVRPGPSGLSDRSGPPGHSGQPSRGPPGHSGQTGRGPPGPAERRQLELRAMLAEKQKELESLLNKEKLVCVGSEGPKIKSESRNPSIVNQSYNSEHEEPVSISEQMMIEAQNVRDNESFRVSGESVHGGRSLNTLPSHMGSTYVSDSDSASRMKSNQRNRGRRRQPQDRQPEEISPSSTSLTNHNMRHEPRMDTANVNTVPPMTQTGEPAMLYPPPPPCWGNNKLNQDMRANQFTQNSHSQTMERLLNTPQMTYPPSMPFNMMMPYGMVGGCGCGCGCGVWGAWCWQQLLMQQRDIHQLREQLNHLEERWRAETASHTLNNQVPPGNRANNYWDNFRSYSRQNLLSASSKTNADGYLTAGPAHNPHPLVERSHNTLHPSTSSTPPSNTPKRNINTATCSHNAVQSNQAANNAEESSGRHARSNVTYERSMSFSSAPDVLNLNQNNDPDPPTAAAAQARNFDHVNINRQDATNSFRNVNIAHPIPEIIQSHANNINTTNTKKKSSSKLPAKNSSSRRNYALDYSQTGNINIESTPAALNTNLASTSREVGDKAATQLFEFLRENVYSEVTALIGVNESHPDFLIQLFRELQLISSDPLRQRVLQSIRNVLSQYPSIEENEAVEHRSPHDDLIPDAVSTTTNDGNNYYETNIVHELNGNANAPIDNGIVRFLLLKSEDICTAELLESLAAAIMRSPIYRHRHPHLSKKRLIDSLAKYEGSRVCDVSGDILESLTPVVAVNNEGDESTQHTSEHSESSHLQDVAGSLNLFSSSDTQLHQMSGCPYELAWGHVRMEPAELTEGNDSHSGQEGKGDMCSDMLNGDLAEADQTCRSEGGASTAAVGGAAAGGGGGDALPDVVDTDETTPTEAEAEWLGLDRVPTRLHMEEESENQKD